MSDLVRFSHISSVLVSIGQNIRNFFLHNPCSCYCVSQYKNSPTVFNNKSYLTATVKIISIFGTRPEAIKMAPIVKLLEKTPGVESIVCVTGQHRSMLDQVLHIFDINPHYDLNIMTSNQSLNGVCSRILTNLDPIFEQENPDRVLVHGDTSTAAMAAIAAFHHQIPVGHVEAGLRTGNLLQPWPEEMNRRVVDVISDYLFAPTRNSADNLSKENLSGKTIITGNTVIDALYHTVDMIDSNISLQRDLDGGFPFLDKTRRLILVTGHRRENFGQGLEHICNALTEIAQDKSIDIVYPVHLNPKVKEPVEKLLSHHHNIYLIPPQDYLQFVRLMQHADLILTDSGGIQEEAPALNIPVFVTREVTERPEALASGKVKLVGTDKDRIVTQVRQHLTAYPNKNMNKKNHHNPYGDGLAAKRIISVLTQQPYHAFASNEA